MSIANISCKYNLLKDLQRNIKEILKIFYENICININNATLKINVCNYIT